MAQPWSHLPNAALIDWVLQSMKDRPKLWAEAREATLTATLDAAWTVARTVARIVALEAAWDAAWVAARIAARDAAWNAARDAAGEAISALVAYDDCDQYLSMTYDELRLWARLSEAPQAVLLLPMKWVQEYEALVASA